MQIDELVDLYKLLAYKIEAEGFDYCFTAYSEWKEFKDIDPHLFKLIKTFRDARNELASYLDAMEIYDDEF